MASRRVFLAFAPRSGGGAGKSVIGGDGSFLHERTRHTMAARNTATATYGSTPPTINLRTSIVPFLSSKPFEGRCFLIQQR
jgi:hypothetical protein